MRYRMYRGSITGKWAMHVAVEGLSDYHRHKEPDWIPLGKSNMKNEGEAIAEAKIITARAMNKGRKGKPYGPGDIRTEAEGKEGGIKP